MLGGLLARGLGQPALLGYILAGVVIGPNTPGLVTDRGTVELLANLGVAFLMFVLGLEFSLADLAHVRRVALLAGGLQIALTVAGGTLLGTVIGWEPTAAILLGVAFAISSSLVTIKLLAGQGELESNHARLALGIGVVQDLCLVPLLALLPVLTGTADDPALALARSVGIAALALIAVIVVGTRLVPRILYLLARTGSRELFLMAIVVIALGTGLASRYAGLSFALGAYLAGVVVSASEFDGQVLAQIAPLRDLFATIFFVAVGMLLDPPFLVAHVRVVIILVGALVAGKLLVTLGSLLVAGVERRTALLSATVLAQMGEFSFVLASLGLARGIVSDDQYGLILSVALASILIVSLLLPVMPAIAAAGARGLPLRSGERVSAAETLPPPGALHAVICGASRVGARLGQLLEQEGFSHTMIDLDPVEVRRLRATGTTAFYGDAAAEPLLARAGIARARILAIAIPDLVSAAEAIRVARRLNPEIRIIAVATTHGAIGVLETAGANVVVQPDFEAAVGLGRHVLRWLGVAAPDARAVMAEERTAFYGTAQPATSASSRQIVGHDQTADAAILPASQ